MRSAIDLPPVPWRGVTAFALDNILPVLGFTAIVIGAFHLPGGWGQIAGWIAIGVATIYTRHLIDEDVKALKTRAKSESIERAQARARAEIEARRLRVAA